jgi:ribonuclease HII
VCVSAKMPPKKKSAVADNKEESTMAATTLTLPRTIEERLMKDQSLDFVIGVDEAGRGPLAGPVVAGACVFLTPKELIRGVKDSKQIDEKGREELYEVLSKRTDDVIWAVGEIDNNRIDEINILQSTFEAMTAAAESVIQQLGKTFKNPKFHILIDGNKVPPQLKAKYECTAVVKGDGKEFIIGAASVFAKVTRDRIMYQLHDKYPQYNFAQHKGYGTASHFQAVFKYGPCEYHRFTFAPIKHMDTGETTSQPPTKNKKEKDGGSWGKKNNSKQQVDNRDKKINKKKQVPLKKKKEEAPDTGSKRKSESIGVRRSTRLKTI